jgi:pyridinium-3,5-biscarboxylic acid mononucleotide synthase
MQPQDSETTARLANATLDLDRARRCGFPEVVFGEGKTVAALEKIFQRLLEERMPVLATRVSEEKAESLVEMFPEGVYNTAARTFRISTAEAKNADARVGRVVVVTAGTSDLPVAEEARETLDWMGVGTEMLHDIGVAGPHRLLEKLHAFEGADAAVVAAGMEGALPSVVGGHVPCPVIAVPTSVGYGASFGGLAALLGMLNSCAANVVVVNIDAGFKAGYVAGLIAHRKQRHA